MTVTSSSATPLPDRTSPLPRPTGPYPVGRQVSECVDPDRHDIYADDATAARRLVLWTWYPAGVVDGSRRAAYLPHRWAPVAAVLGLAVDGVSSNAFTDAPLSRDRDTFPVVLLSPSGFPPLLLGGLAEELASHGYVVVGVNHTYETSVTAFGDGQVVPMNPAAVAGVLGPQAGPHDQAFERRAEVCLYKAADLGSVADHLSRVEENPTGLDATRLDLATIGAVGHSFGGNAALEWCRADRRCPAAANLDGALWTEAGRSGIPGPALQVLADHAEFSMASGDAVAAGLAPDAAWYEAERTITLGGWWNLHHLAHPGATARIAGATHTSFMDLGFLPLTPDGPAGGLVRSATIDPVRMWRITSDLLLAFFARHLRGTAGVSLDSVFSSIPEVTSGPPRPA